MNNTVLNNEIKTYTCIFTDGTGFSTKLLNHLDPWVLAEAVRYVATECPVDLKTDNITIQAMIVDKAIVVMNDEEFKEIVPYFLGTSKLVEELKKGE